MELIQKKKFDMYSQKREQAKQTQGQLQKDIQRKEWQQMEQLREKELKRESIRQMAAKGKEQAANFRQTKVALTKQEMAVKTEEEKRLIYKLEREAQQLESLEEQLIKRLQQIQDEEKAAFKELETVMIQASMPRKERLEVV